MGQYTLLQLRRADTQLTHLPERIVAPRLCLGAVRSIPVTEATIDDLAFAIAKGRFKPDHILHPTAALEHLYFLARAAGCKGTETAVQAVLKRGGQ